MSSLILHLVTDSRQLTGDGAIDVRRRCLLRQVEFAVESGVDAVQLRERDLDAGQLESLTREVVVRTRNTRTLVLVNDRVDVALASGADGVHLRADSAPPRDVRAITPPGFRIGRSVHSQREAAEVAADVDYLVAGTIWPTPSKPEAHALLGLDGLTAIARSVNVPVLAIGGVSIDRLHDVAVSGAAGIASIRLFMAEHAATEIVKCRAIPLQHVVFRSQRI